MKNKIRKSVEYSIKDGICWANMVGFVEPYIVPFSLNLGASNLFVGFIRSLPALISSFSQIITEYFVYKYQSCKKVIYYSVVLQAISIFLASFCIFISSSFYAKYLFLILIIGYSFSGSIATAPWFTLMGEYIPQDKRGVFFGFRTQLIGVFYFISSFTAGYILKHNPDNKIIFFYLFLLASLFRFCSAYYISLMYEPENKFHIPKKIEYGFKIFLNFKIDDKMEKIYISIFLLLFSTYIAAPYFSVYVLKELNFDYIKYMFVVSFGQVISWSTSRWWGKIVDRYGSIYAAKYAFLSIPLISFMWMFTRNFYLLFLIEIFSGIVWGAFSIIYNTIVYEYIKPLERTKYMAYLIFVMSLSQFLGSIIGGIIYDKVHFDKFSTFIFILLISTVGRFIAYLYFRRYVLAKSTC